jgi:hypothetical protein
VDRAVVNALPLKLTMAAVVAKLGQPQRIEHNVGVLPDKKSKGLGHHKISKHVRTVPIVDYIYGVKGGKPTDSIDLTFYKGKLSSVLIRTASTPAAAAAASTCSSANSGDHYRLITYFAVSKQESLQNSRNFGSESGFEPIARVTSLARVRRGLPVLGCWSSLIKQGVLS